MSSLSQFFSIFFFSFFLSQFPKSNTKNTFYGLLQCKIYLLFFIISKQNGCLFPILRSQVFLMFPFLTFICLCNLRHIHFQCLSQCKINLTHGNQHSQHPKNGPKIARNSKARWKLFKKIKTDDSSFKRERNRVDYQKRPRKKYRKALRRRI